VNRFLAALVAGTLIAAGCSSGKEEVVGDLFPTTTTVASASTTVVTTTTVPPTGSTVVPSATTVVPTSTTLADHTLEYTPIRDSFSFENFGGGEAPADLTVNMARRLYGDRQVCSDVTDNQCTPYPVILQLIAQANRSMQGGLCEGLTVLSLRLANDIDALSSFQGTQTVADLVKEDPALLSELAYWYVTQFATEVQEEASSYLEMHPVQLAEILLRDFAAAEEGKPSTGYTVGIYSSAGGHAVTPYRVEETKSGYRIYIYDSNWPTSERWIDVDQNGWVYALAATNPTQESSAWSGGTGTMELTPMRARSGPFSCGFCPTDSEEESGTLLTVASSGDKQMALKIETESGDRLGYYDGGFVNEIEGATYRYLISGPTTSDPVLVFLPPGVETFSADVEEIDVPTPAATAETLTEVTEALPEQEPEEDTQKFSLLLLNEDKSVQIEAVIVEEVEPDPDEPVVEEPEEISLIAFSEESVAIADIEEATVAIAIDSLEVEIELDAGQTVELVTAQEEAPPSPEQPVVQEAQTLDISIQDNEGETLAAVAVDLSIYRVDVPVAPPVDPGPTPGPTTIPPAPVVVPVVIEITYDEVAREVTQEEEVVEAWVASDAEYYQAIAEDTLDEVLGASYVEELEEREEWTDEESDGTLLAVIINVEEDYWEDEQWEEVSYTEEYFEEIAEEEPVWEEVLDADDWFEEGADTWVDEWAEEEEQHILEEMGLEEWDEDLMGPSPTETIEWEEEDWETFDAEQEALWEAEEELWEEEESWELDTEEEWDEWQDEFWPEDADWCEECEEGPWDDPEWDDPAQWEDDPEEWEEEEEVEEEEVWEEEPIEEDPFQEPDWDNWTAEDEEALILEELGVDEWPEDWGPSPTESWEWTEEDWEAWETEQWETEEDVEEEEDSTPPEDPEGEDDPNLVGEDDNDDGGEETETPLEEEDVEQGSLDDPEWEDEDDPFTDDLEDDTTLDEEPLSDPDLPPETEVDEEQVDEEEVPPTTTVEPPPTTTEPPPTTTVAPPPPTTVPSWDPYADCRGTSACESAPGGFTTWEAYDAANDPGYYDDLGTPPGGYATWVDFVVEVEAGIVDPEIAAEVLPEDMAEEFIPEPEPVYVPTVTMTNIAVSLQETISTSTATAQTGTATSTNVSAAESGILTQNTNDGHWHLDTTTVTTTATTVTNTLVDTTTVVARTGVDFVSCTYVDNVQSGCSTQRSWNDPTTTATAGDAYTEASTTTAVVSATVNTEEGCSEGGWRGMGDWCMVESGSRTDYDFIQVTIPEEECSPGCAVATLTIDAETNLTQAQFQAGNNVYGDPYIFLNRDDHGGDGDHSGDTDAINVGIAFASNDDGGRDCGNTCANPPSSAVDVDETPNITYCASGGACTNGVPVIDNVSDSWDSRIVINVAAADYVVRASVYNSSHDGWYRLTIDSEPYTP
jgi:hypothetical protein